MLMYLSNFERIRPPFEKTQNDTLEWLVNAHAMAEGNNGEFRQKVKERLAHVGCKAEHIEKRGYVLADFSHSNWEEMQVYRLHEKSSGMDLSVRAKVFEEEADKIFEQYYPEGSLAPDDLIHVSCTGYVSPSPAQKIISKRGFGQNTTVTHAYHMGCYGSIPAIRMGKGFLSASPTKSRIDIVHTEICSLHVNPSLHETDQLVSQSLFADGFMKYSISPKTPLPSLKVLNLREEIIPDSTEAMTWNVMGWGFQMSLAKEVPVYITRYLVPFLERLAPNETNLLFAVHPGGPKILNYVQKICGLSDATMRFSYGVLRKYGNMSSATLPHIWQEILEDESIVNGTKIVSLAFGPGLTIAGALLEKSCGY